MKKQLAVIAVLATVGGFAKADDKGTEFKFGGEVRQTYFNNQAANLSGGVSNGGGTTTTSSWADRNMFHVNAISSDKLQAYFNFVHTAVWGGALGVPTNTQPYANNPGGSIPNTTNVSVQNSLQVNEAWLWWKLSDNTSLRSGRQSMDYGDGLVFSKNDWLGTPYNADSIMGRMSWDFMDLDLGGGTLADVGTPSTGAGTDAQLVFYGFYAQFKGLPDFLKTADLFVLQANVDAGTAPNTFLPGYVAGGGNLGLTSIGLHVKGMYSIVDYRLDGVIQTGKENTGGTVTQGISFGGNMIDAEVGANFPEFMKGRVFVNYHVDSGDNSSAAVRTSQNAYQPLFFDRHSYTGGMNMFGFGNLTNLRIGASLSPSEDTTFGLEVDMLSRTSTTALGSGGFSATNWLSAAEGNMYGGVTGATGLATPLVATNGANSSLGTVYNIHATHNYGHGFSMLAQVGYLTLGNYFSSGSLPTSNPMQFVGQAKYAF